MFFNELWIGVVQSSIKDLKFSCVGELGSRGWKEQAKGWPDGKSKSTGSLLSICHFGVGLRLYQL
jgi:hypothetical protein